MARYALVIGIAEYQQRSYLKTLPKAAIDAEAVAKVLEQYGDYTVTRLPKRWNAETESYEVAQQKSVSADDVSKALKTLLSEQGKKSDVLIYFAGHGLTFCDNLGEQKGALAASDCQVEKVGEKVVDYKNGIALSSLNRLIRDSDLSSLVMLLDCCHSGYFLENQLVRQTLTAFSTEKDYYLITACRSFETVKALGGETHAIFTGALLNGLASENANRNGDISGDRLFDYISNKLKGNQWEQEAIRMGWGRSITLVTYPQPETPTEITFNRDNPYRGLNAFESEHKQYFFGRKQAIKTLTTHLTTSRFLPVIGYSGSGKSSLIKAGLLPELSQDRIPDSSQWSVESFTPGKHPLEQLIDILARYREQNQPLVIFIDQFEEVFTLCEDEAKRQGFIRLIAKEMNDNERKTRMIIALRGDFLTRCAEYPEMLNLINHIPTTTYIVKSLEIEELPDAIEKPAELHGVKFERGLVSQIVQDVANQPGALPLLQYALKELWRVCIEKPESPDLLLTKKGYEEIGGVQGALENRANVIYESFSDSDQVFVRKLFMELVQLDEGKEVTRRRVDWDKLGGIADSPEQLDRVVERLAGAQQRLIIADEKTVEVVHEALLSKWKLLSIWIEKNRENIRISRRLEVACREWQDYGGKFDDLLQGSELNLFEKWQEKSKYEISALDAEFLRKSVEKRDREEQAELEQERQLRELAEAKAKAEAARAEEERAKTIAQMERAIAAEDKVNAEAARTREAEARVRVQKQRTRLAIASGILLTFTLGLGLLSNVLVGQKREQEAMTVGKLISTSKTLFNNQDQLMAMIAGIQALSDLEKLKGKDAIVPDELKSVIAKVREYNRLEHSQPVKVVSFNPNGKTLATGSKGGSIKIWTAEGKVLPSLSKDLGHKKTVWSIDYSKDGTIASASADKLVKIWDANGNFVKNLTGHTNVVYDVNWNPINNNTVVSCSEDGTIRLWDVTKGKQIDSLTNQVRLVRLDFSPDGSKVAFLANNNEVNIWNIKPKKNENRVITIGKHDKRGQDKGIASFVKFNGDGTILASSDYDGNIKLWNVRKNEEIRTIRSGIGIQGLAFGGKEDKIIAAALVDGSVKMWNLDGSRSENLEGHHSQVSSLSFNLASRSEIVIASASDDKTVKLWKIDNSRHFDDKVKNLLKYSCDFLASYFQTHQELSSEGQESRIICQKSRTE